MHTVTSARFRAFSLAGDVVPLRATLMDSIVPMPVTLGGR